MGTQASTLTADVTADVTAAQVASDDALVTQYTFCDVVRPVPNKLLARLEKRKLAPASKPNTPYRNLDKYVFHPEAVYKLHKLPAKVQARVCSNPEFLNKYLRMVSCKLNNKERVESRRERLQLIRWYKELVQRMRASCATMSRNQTLELKRARAEHMNSKVYIAEHNRIHDDTMRAWNLHCRNYPRLLLLQKDKNRMKAVEYGTNRVLDAQYRRSKQLLANVAVAEVHEIYGDIDVTSLKGTLGTHLFKYENGIMNVIGYIDYTETSKLLNSMAIYYSFEYWLQKHFKQLANSRNIKIYTYITPTSDPMRMISDTPLTSKPALHQVKTFEGNIYYVYINA